MAGQNTGNTTAFIEAQQYSQFILENLHDGLLPDSFLRDVSDFGNGTTLNIKTIGTATLQDVTEDTPLVYNAIDTGTVTLSITDYVGDAWYVTDVLRQDGNQIEALQAARAMEATRAIQENFETRFLSVLNAAQTATNVNAVNGFSHRMSGSGTNDTLELADLNYMKLAFDKANVPMNGRVGIVDPVVGASLNAKFNTGYDVNRQPVYQQMLENGFDREHQFVMNIYGWDIWTSNRLPTIASEAIVTYDGTANTVTTGVANIFMSVMDDNTKPGMVAWRQPPKVETERNKDFQRDEFLTTARWGLGVQREDTLGVIVTDATAIE
jgi:hypothetical protein